MSDEPIPRADEPVPPGMVKESFWQRSATIGAIAATITFGLALLRPWLVSKLGEVGAAGAESLVWSWAIAFGIDRTTEGFRWK
jgi:hypothetical protein